MSKSSKNKECQDAYENPSCPYVAQINQQNSDIVFIKDKISHIEKALIGDDMQGGIVAEITKLKSWTRTLGPYILLIVSAIITYVISKSGH